MDPIKVLKKIMQARSDLLKDRKGLLLSGGDPQLKYASASLDIPELEGCQMLNISFDKCVEEHFRQVEASLILDFPESLQGESIGFYESEVEEKNLPMDEGPFVDEAINRFQDHGSNSADDEYFRRKGFIQALAARKLLPTKVLYNGAEVSLPIRVFFRAGCPAIGMRKIRDLQDVKTLTIEKYASQWKLLINEMSYLIGGKDIVFPVDWEISRSIIERAGKDRLLRSVDLACIISHLEHKAVVDISKSRSWLCILLIVRLIIYAEKNIKIWEILELRVSQIEVRNNTICFSGYRMSCPKSFLKLLQAYIGIRQGVVFINENGELLTTVWLSKKLPMMLSKLCLSGDVKVSKRKITPSSIQKSSWHVKCNMKPVLIPTGG